VKNFPACVCEGSSVAHSSRREAAKVFVVTGILKLATEAQRHRDIYNSLFLCASVSLWQNRFVPKQIYHREANHAPPRLDSGGTRTSTTSKTIPEISDEEYDALIEKLRKHSKSSILN
jgi:hypothetical protein